MNTSYPDYHRQLQRRIAQLYRELPGPMGGFGDLNRTTLTEGALSLKTKELMALAMAIHARCEGCVAYHVHDCLRAGATREELLETVAVAVLMGGAPCLIYGAEVLEALEQFGNLAAAP
ncbi:carboxymuconolactone decarboxylase family protein [Deinococcus budaensis]|uniref:AhpD family alkylhydroperoxidase n=1 Tax=Deinococcus budaensis TaxID=1665626 RepID=A0A7W8GES0_9DEIO|nr:carboxymuconolactone decarboxylase family protein [Deinococcus budaensis]MBB5233963.1 AhpD family alkylhydroperoxidase [Deinococcus budaensis]